MRSRKRWKLRDYIGRTGPEPDAPDRWELSTERQILIGRQSERDMIRDAENQARKAREAREKGGQ